MRYLLICFFILVAQFAIAAQVLVLVDGKAITTLDVEKRIEALKMVSPGLLDSIALRQQTLNNLVSEELFHHEAKRLKISVSTEEIKSHFKDLQQDYHLSEEKLKILMGNSSLWQQIESRLLWNKLVSSVFYNKVKVSDAEVQEEQKIKSIGIQQVTFKQILFKAFELEKIEKLKKEVKNCDDLDYLAKENGLPKPNTNTINFEDLNKDLQSVVKNISLNKLSDTINAGEYKEVIMVCHKEVSKNSYSIHQIRQELGARKINAEAQKYLLELKKRVYVEYITPIE